MAGIEKKLDGLLSLGEKLDGLAGLHEKLDNFAELHEQISNIEARLNKRSGDEYKSSHNERLNTY